MEAPTAPGGSLQSKFDLRELVAKSSANKRQLRRIAVGIAVPFAVLWGLFVFPRFFESPHASLVCSHGACAPTPASDYFLNLWLETGGLLGVVALALLLGLVFGYSRDPVLVGVDPEGISVEFTRGGPKRIGWGDRSLDCVLRDEEGFLRRNPPKPGQFVPRFSMRSGWLVMPLEEDAVNAIITSARNAGASVVDSAATGHGDPEERTFSIGPRPTR